jgi:hypothetical protein
MNAIEAAYRAGDVERGRALNVAAGVARGGSVQSGGALRAVCEHVDIRRYVTVDGSSVLWACADCRIRFYPHGPESRRGCPEHDESPRADAATSTPVIRSAEGRGASASLDSAGRFTGQGSVLGLDSSASLPAVTTPKGSVVGGRRLRGSTAQGTTTGPFAAAAHQTATERPSAGSARG